MSGRLADRAETIEMVCEALENEDRQKAGELVRSRYPFDPPVVRRRSLSKFDRTRVFLRDGFLDRYSDDRIFGTPERDIILAKGGDDYIEAKEGDDEVRGASGAEFISGYEGDDLLIGHGGIDVISDQSFGNDVDTLRGGPQNDRLYSDDGDGFDFLQCGRGTSDQVTVDAGDTVSTNCETVNEAPTSP